MSVAITKSVDSRISMSPDQLLTLANEKDFELVNGQLVEHRSGFKSSHIAGRLLGLLFVFNEVHRLGWLQISDCGYLLPHLRGNTVRKPDVSFVTFEKLPAVAGFPEGYPAIAPDLAVEVLSPNDLAYEVEAKINDYLQAGVRLIWIINPAGRSVQVYRRDASSDRLVDSEELNGEDVLPGFACHISRLFEIPQVTQ